MKSLFMFLFVVNFSFETQVFLDNSYQGTFSDGSENNPFKSLIDCMTLTGYNEIDITILSTFFSYEINSSWSINYNTTIVFPSKDDEKANIIIQKTGNLQILGKKINFLLTK